MAFANLIMLLYILNISYDTRGVANHSPLLINLSFEDNVCKGHCKIKPHWLKFLIPK